MEERKKEKKSQKEGAPETIDAGDILFAWEAWEYPQEGRSGAWYATAGLLGLGCMIYAIFTANYIFAVLLVIFAIFLMMRDLKKPERIATYITTQGIVFNNELYPFEKVRDFSITYNPPKVKNLYVSFVGTKPILSIPLEDANPNLIRAAMLPFVQENLLRQGESLTDTLRRVYKL